MQYLTHPLSRRSKFLSATNFSYTRLVATMRMMTLQEKLLVFIVVVLNCHYKCSGHHHHHHPV